MRTASFLRDLGITLLLVASSTTGAGAWVYPEHRNIAILSIETLDPEHRATFDTLWAEASARHDRLCPRGADTEQSTTPDCIDWAAFSAISGDHSCSAADALRIVLDSRWILTVADVAAQLEIDLSQIEVTAPADQTADTADIVGDLQRRMASEADRAERINALRTADTRLQRADPEYATRAGSNNAHFLLARPSTETGRAEYAKLALRPDSEINAMGVYGWYHLRALEKAKRLSRGGLSRDERAELARAMLVDEAFGLHFLEDMFAAGHVAGTWGDASQRKGTHDYYNEAGLEVFTWDRDGTGVVLMGDAHMRPQDANLAAKAVRRSLVQVLETAAGGEDAVQFELRDDVPSTPEDFDVCRNDTMPEPGPDYLRGPDLDDAFQAVLIPTAVPFLGPGLGAMPRFRAEVGPFAGLVASIDGRGTDGGFVPGQSAGAIGGLDIGARFGLGLEGVMGESGDGLVFAQVGLRGDTASSSSLDDTELSDEFGSAGAAIPSRVALQLRFRMPFYLVPGDLVLLSPVFFFAPETYAKMAVTAGNGGLIPWQQGLATRFGRFQMVLGREVGVGLYGLFGDDDRIVVPASKSATGESQLVDLRSTAIDLPILEYRPYRSFSSNQSSQLLFQLFTTIDIPSAGTVLLPPGEPDADLRTVWSAGLRFTFDWRYYF